MSQLAISRQTETQAERRQWAMAAMVALAAHLGVAGLVLAWSRPHEAPLPEPVVLVELPADAAPAPAPAEASEQPQPQPQMQPQQMVTPPIEVPPVRAPLPQNPVTLPPPAPPQPVRAAAPAAPAAASPAPPVQNAASTNTAPGDPRAKKAELDYFSQISAHLNRRKSYPAEAKKARQEGVVVIRFTVDRAGAVSGAGIKRGSGHEILDSATLLLLQRVAPLPRMPAMMQRDSVTLSLPIDYSLKTD